MPVYGIIFFPKPSSSRDASDIVLCCGLVPHYFIACLFSLPIAGSMVSLCIFVVVCGVLWVVERFGKRCYEPVVLLLLAGLS